MQPKLTRSFGLESFRERAVRSTSIEDEHRAHEVFGSLQLLFLPSYSFKFGEELASFLSVIV